MKDNIAIESRMDVPSGTFNYDRWLTKDQLKDHLSIEDTDQDTLLDSYIQSAVEHIESLTGRSLADHTMYYLFNAGGENSTYLFDGIAVNSAALEVKEHDSYSDFYDFDNQADIDFNYNDNIGAIKTIHIDNTNDDYIAIKAPVVWTPANHPVIKTSLMTICSDMYYRREATGPGNTKVNAVLKSQIRPYVRI